MRERAGARERDSKRKRDGRGKGKEEEEEEEVVVVGGRRGGGRRRRCGVVDDDGAGKRTCVRVTRRNCNYVRACPRQRVYGCLLPYVPPRSTSTCSLLCVRVS